MRILAIDVGTGTQDILLFDSEQEPENCFKLVMPSPTTIYARRVRQATAAGRPLLLTGRLMGGGPVGWAVGDHHQAGLPIYATPDAARTFNDDLDRVQTDLGVILIERPDDVPAGLAPMTLHLTDLHLPAIVTTLEAFGIEPRWDILAVAVLDHGNAPPEVSDRVFRFDHIRRVLAAHNDLFAFAYLPDELPDYLTRMRAIVAAAPADTPLLLMDTGPAASLGALYDPMVARAAADVLLVNVGNMHTLATRLVGGRVQAIFEHHTGFLTTEKLDTYLEQLVAGTLSCEAVFNDNGHGAQMFGPAAPQMPFVSVTGPRRSLLRQSRHSSYFAVPFGDMMIAGCWGLVGACAERLPEWQELIRKALPGHWRDNRRSWPDSP